ncbi:MAG: hypothetical protein N3E52_02350 [Candidatus Bathyarchaeota archaeon]|nr:hypothetical protein [Candidatus Bathyarchaeota archaeon]
MEPNSHIKPETHEPTKCHICKEAFNEPIFAAVSSGYLIEEYYACPNCLSKIGHIENSKTKEPEETAEVSENEHPDQKTLIKDKNADSITCAHHMGYLRQRPRNTPIPEECFICAKMIDCMT